MMSKAGSFSLRRPAPDFNQFLKILFRQGRPDHLPCYEHLASPGFMAAFTGIPLKDLTPENPAFWSNYVDFWLDLGYESIPLEIPLDCPLPEGDRKASHASEARAVIHTQKDYEQFPWPSLLDPIDFKPFEEVAALIPEGVKIVGGVCMGPYEWVSTMMGVEGLSLALYDQPGLVHAMFDQIGALILSANRQLANFDAIGALRQGDDLGYNTSTFLSPDDLRSLVFPIYGHMVRCAHNAGKPFILHSCGNLSEVYDDLVEIGIDAKHSFEESILPVEGFKQKYGHRVTPLGGLDVDLICRGSEEEIRACTRKKIESCFSDGYWALGTGNSLTDYMPVEKYLFVLDEGRKIAG
jgi:uroporphyrinogen decarboxylase